MAGTIPGILPSTLRAGDHVLLDGQTFSWFPLFGFVTSIAPHELASACECDVTMSPASAEKTKIENLLMCCRP